jgi:hypothetical protein
MRRRVWWRPAAVGLAGVVLVVGGMLLAAPEPGRGGSTGSALFEVIDVRAEGPRLGTIGAAVDDEELEGLWSEFALAGDPPRVDFGDWVVGLFTIPDDACPPAIARFDRTGDVFTPVFQELSPGCAETLIPRTYVVALPSSTRWATPGGGPTPRRTGEEPGMPPVRCIGNPRDRHSPFIPTGDTRLLR